MDTEVARSLLDDLLADSALYQTTQDYLDLLDFVVRLRNFAPFNAMLLQIQKPGLTYAASAWDWAIRFSRYPKTGARPLLIMWPFGPVALVYDVLDTEGKALPADATMFLATGQINSARLNDFRLKLSRKNICCQWVDAGDGSAGSIRAVEIDFDKKGTNRYQVCVNRNHNPAQQFTTLAHELAHLCLGHLVADAKLSIPKRRRRDHSQQELEAESVAYLVCHRNGVTSKSKVYLSEFVRPGMTTDDLDMYQVVRAAGQVETMLGLSRPTKMPRPKGAMPGSAQRRFPIAFD